MDQGRQETDALLQRMEREIRRQYARAAKELTAKLEKHLKRFEKADKEMLSRLDAGEITDAEYFRWRTAQVMTGKRWEQMRDQLAEDLVHADQLAASVVNGYMPEVYALNHNYGTYEIEHDSQMSTSYTLYNREAVERLLRDDPDMLPHPKVNVPKDMRWNRKQVQSSVLQGILQGEPMDKIARRMQDVCGMDARAAIRNARTATTGAENAGRLDSMNRAISLGVELKKMWLATRDGRTRDSHVLLDGELREVNEEFSNGCMHPGDPHGAPAEVYNCRCAMRSKVAGADPYSPDLSRNERLGGMSYDEWKRQARERESNRMSREKDLSAGGSQKNNIPSNHNIVSNVISKESMSRPENEPKNLQQFKRYSGNKTDSEILQQINPLYNTDPNYQMNCAKCVVAEELLYRGYDVTVKPYNANDGIGKSGTSCWKFDSDNWWKDSQVEFPLLRSQLVPFVKESFEKWGNGARAVARIEFEDDPTGHFIFIKKTGNEIIYSDPQIGDIIDIEETLMRCTPLAYHYWFMRVDNRELTDFVSDAVKNHEE